MSTDAVINRICLRIVALNRGWQFRPARENSDADLVGLHRPEMIDDHLHTAIAAKLIDIQFVSQLDLPTPLSGQNEVSMLKAIPSSSGPPPSGSTITFR